MSAFKEMVKDVARLSRNTASAGLLLPLPTGRVRDPVRIELRTWLELPINERAPVRSVAMVEAVGDDFSALVIDTVAEQLRWRISVPREHLGRLYEGMLGDRRARPRGSMVLSAPLTPPPPPPMDGAGDSDPAPDNTPEDCENCTNAGESDPGDGGIKGDEFPLYLALAKLFAIIQRASPIQVNVLGQTHDALLVPALDAKLAP